MQSYILGLRNPNHPDNPLNSDITKHPVCPSTGGFQEAVYDLDRARRDLDRDAIAAAPRRDGVWRWRALLPVRDSDTIVSLQEGNVPVVHCHRLGAQLGLERLYYLDESRNPTGSFKDRGASVTISKAKEVGITGTVLASSGNAATSFSAYCARAGIRFYGFMRRETAAVHRLQALSYGGRILVVEGDMVDGTTLAQQVADAHGVFHCTQPYNLYRAEGKKTAAFELAEALQWQSPDRVLIPTAGGTNVMAFYKGFRELLALGWIDRMPALDVVQSANCAPIYRAWSTGDPVRYWEDNSCRSTGLGHPFPKAGDAVVRIVNETGGRCWLVQDDDNFAAARQIARLEGLFLQPASAAPAAALATINDDEIETYRGQRIVCIGTGSGKNQVEAPLAALDPAPEIPATLDAFERYL